MDPELLAKALYDIWRAEETRTRGSTWPRWERVEQPTQDRWRRMANEVLEMFQGALLT